MTEFTYTDNKKGEQSTAPIHKLSPYRLGQLAPIRKKYPSADESVITLFEMAKVDPTISFVEGVERENIIALLGKFNSGQADEDTTKKILLSVMSHESRFDDVEARIKEAQEYITAMCEFPKNVKLDSEFWENQSPKEVLKLGKFFRTEIEECFS